jgi:hypothetical protein
MSCEVNTKNLRTPGRGFFKGRRRRAKDKSDVYPR